MKLRSLVYAVSLVCLVFAHPAFADPVPGSTSRWIVVYKNGSTKSVLLANSGGKLRHKFRIIPGYAADLTPAEVEQLKHDPSVARVHPDYVRHAAQATTATRSAYGVNFATTAVTPPIVPYGIDLVHARDVWPYTRGSGVKIADLDTGIDFSHPDLPNVITSATFTSSSTQDTNSHGTHTAGTLAAPGKNGGVEGVAPDAGLLIGQVFDSQGNAYDSDIIAGIEWAVQNGANVINMSLGGTDYDASLDQACQSAVTAGAVVVAAAGNDGTNVPNYPAAYSSVISVAAVDQSKQVASFSNYGSTIDLCAPGVQVLSTVPVGTGWLVSANWGGTEHQAESMTGSANGSVGGSAIYCGLGNPSDFPPSVSGQIAHIRRGTLTFQDKVANAVAAGAVGVIVSNNTSGAITGTLNGSTSIPVVGVSQANGDDLQANSGITATVTSQNPADYQAMDGTSMATPHVSGVAALLFGARHGHITSADVRSAMEASAQDLGAAGRDDYYGHGLVNAAAALGQVIPIVQSSSSSPSSVTPGGPVTVSVHLTTTSGLSSVTANGVALTLNGGAYTGNVPADNTLGLHTIDVAVSDTWGNVHHYTNLTYTTLAGNPPMVAISAPSVNTTNTGPVSYTVTYTGATAVTLAASNVTVNATGTASGTVSVSGTGNTTRTVTLSSIKGSGSLGISIAASTASNASGPAPAAGPGATFTVVALPLSIAFVFPTTGSACTRNCSDLTISGTAGGGSGIAGVTWLLNGITSGTCTGTTNWSATGLTLSPGTNSIQVTATDSGGGSVSATLSVIYTDSAPGSLWQGMAMISLPIVPDQTDPRLAVGFSGNAWYRYDASVYSYVQYPNQQSWFMPPSTTPGRGYWAMFPAGGAALPHGNIPDQTQPKAIHLYRGWNLIGTPFVNDVRWDVQAITISRTGGTTDQLMNAGDAVANYVWGWDTAKGSYFLVKDPRYSTGDVGVLNPWRAYWMRAYKECDLILPAP